MRYVLAIAALCIAAPTSAQYAVSHTYALGGEGGWDYVIPDPSHHRLFIARQDRVIVVDERTGKLLGEISGIHGAHGVALVDKTGRGFATSSEDSSIYIFDAQTLKILLPCLSQIRLHSDRCLGLRERVDVAELAAKACLESRVLSAK